MIFAWFRSEKTLPKYSSFDKNTWNWANNRLSGKRGRGDFTKNVNYNSDRPSLTPHIPASVNWNSKPTDHLWEVLRSKTKLNSLYWLQKFLELYERSNKNLLQTDFYIINFLRLWTGLCKLEWNSSLQDSNSSLQSSPGRCEWCFHFRSLQGRHK